MTSRKAPLPNNTEEVELDLSQRSASGYLYRGGPKHGPHLCVSSDLPLYLRIDAALKREHEQGAADECPLHRHYFTTELYRKDAGGYQLCRKCGAVLTSDDVVLRVSRFDGVLYEYSHLDCEEMVKDLLAKFAVILIAGTCKPEGPYPDLNQLVKGLLKANRRALEAEFSIPSHPRQPKRWMNLRRAQGNIECRKCPHLGVAFSYKVFGPLGKPLTISESSCNLYEEEFREIDHENWLRCAQHQKEESHRLGWRLIDEYPCPDLEAQLKTVYYGRGENLLQMDVGQYLLRNATRTTWDYSQELLRRGGERKKPKPRIDDDEPGIHRDEKYKDGEWYFPLASDIWREVLVEWLKRVPQGDKHYCADLILKAQEIQAAQECPTERGEQSRQLTLVEFNAYLHGLTNGARPAAYVPVNGLLLFPFSALTETARSNDVRAFGYRLDGLVAIQRKKWANRVRSLAGEAERFWKARSIGRWPMPFRPPVKCECGNGFFKKTCPTCIPLGGTTISTRWAKRKSASEAPSERKPRASIPYCNNGPQPLYEAGLRIWKIPKQARSNGVQQLALRAFIAQHPPPFQDWHRANRKSGVRFTPYPDVEERGRSKKVDSGSSVKGSR